MQRLVFMFGMRRLERFGPVTRAAPDFVEAQIARDGEEPGRKLRRDPVASGGFVNLHEDVLGEVFSFGGVAQRAVDEVRYRSLVFIHQVLESLAVASLDTKHQGRIRIEVGRHGHKC